MKLSEIISLIKEKNKNKRIAFPNSNDKRVLEAVKVLIHEWHNPVVCWKQEELSRFKDLNIEKIENTSDDDNNIFVAKMLSQWKVDAMISGNISPTAHVVKALIKNVGTKEDIKRLSSHFMMQTQRWLFLVADCAVQAAPDAEQLAEIAVLTAQSALAYWIHPKIAMLSFSTTWSASHEIVTKVQDATFLARQLLQANHIEAIIDGELQLDSAVVPEVAALKCPNSPLKWEANILIFPDLNSGNIGYKLMQRFGWAQAIWPIIQGLQKPWNDLSRWCSVEDILHMYYITANS